ncbi:MAG TPA: hypothetical protein VFX70_00030 [Mycobacteriales bacterium]|nr:hypothetical protein [Mycobacteriales bacterium]
MRGRDRERSALAGWPDDHEADLYRDDSSPPESLHLTDPCPITEPADTRDPQREFWEP